MNKLLNFFDKYVLKFGVSLAIIFIALYPKLPSVHINHTWVYIRLEDFLILAVTAIWFIQLIRRKVKLPFPVATPIILYWVAGLCSLVFSLLFIGPHLANFFPKVAALEYLRRIEYMILFFVGFSTVKSEQDIKDYLKILAVTLTGVILYGFGQRWYIMLWNAFPHFFEKYSFCFPSFQTGNEEFAKGLPLCLPPDARITSTFGGHYDLAAYLVFVIPVLFGAIFAFKNWFAKVYFFLLSIGGIILLILTSSRISYVAYLVGACCMFLFLKKKKYILPIIIISIALLMLFSASTAKRFLETIRIASVVTNNQGQVVGVTTSSLPQDLQNKISKNPVVVSAPPPSQNLPTGSSFITLPGQGTETNVAVVKTKAPTNVAKNLNLAYGGVEISTISGTFLVKKALVYDISFTTRFQGEWPSAWGAFMRNPILGSGYSAITLASDSDYFRTLGESGALGFLTFSLVFVVLGIFLKQIGPNAPNSFAKYVAYGMAGGIVGLAINATFIDVFEASKVAEPLWLLLGIGTGGLMLYQKKAVLYKKGLFRFFTSAPLIGIYLFIILGIVYFGSVSNFFVADDFTWLKWAASSKTIDIIHYFTNAGGFFYRPLDKLLIFIIFTFSAFKPEGFHIVMLLIHLIIALVVYKLLFKLFKRHFFAFFGAVIFLVSPSHGEITYWIATVSNLLSGVFIVGGLYAWMKFREKKSYIQYGLSIICFALALLSYEIAVMYPLLLVLFDIFYLKPKKEKKRIYEYVPYILLLSLYAVVRAKVNVAPIGGDYAYSIPHFIPNFFGNLFGYIGLFISGESFLPFYTALRDGLRAYWLPMIVVVVAAVAVIAIILARYKKVFTGLIAEEKNYHILFGLAFAIIALLPFLGLGNISERYIYVASIGFAISTVGILAAIYDGLKKKYPRKAAFVICTVLAVILVSVYGVMSQNESIQWQKAGVITQKTLAIIRTKYFNNVGPNQALFFINIPIKVDNAWVFPVGLNDALWFIYRDSAPKIYQMKTVEAAREIANDKYLKANFIFQFDKKGDLQEIKQ